MDEKLGPAQVPRFFTRRAEESIAFQIRRTQTPMAKIGAGRSGTATARSKRRPAPLLRLISVIAIVSTLSIHRQFHYATRTGDFDKDPCAENKERVFRILKQATQSVVNNECSASRWFSLSSTIHVYGKTTCDIRDICDQIPEWQQVTHLYGDEPVVIGMEGCANYRKQLHGREVAVRVAGLYNSGTHALISSLEDNLPHLNSGSVSDVPWGKHLRISHREEQLFPKNDTETPLDTVLPVIVVRDPFRWMTSMVSFARCYLNLSFVDTSGTKYAFLNIVLDLHFAHYV